MNALRTIFILFVLLISCQEEGPEIVVDDPVDDHLTTLGMGEFIDLNSGHNISGKVVLLEDAQHNRILRFEDFSVVNGPDVNVYLSKTSSYQDVIDLGDLKGTSGNINYLLETGIPTDDHKFVLVWCVKYAVLFGYAEIK